MWMRNIKVAAVATLLFALGACDGGALTGPQEEIAPEPPVARTACQAGGLVALRAGCMDDGTAGETEYGDELAGQPGDDFKWFEESDPSL